jgi:hypothetical protein
MTKKRPASLELALAGDTTAGDAAEVVHLPQVKPYEKATVYMPRAALKRLKQMALDHDRRVNDFLQEGVDLMLAKYGQPSLKEFERK